MRKRISFEVDIQNDFILEDGALSVPGATGIIDAILFLNGRADYVIATADSHIESDGEFIVNGGPFPFHCMKGTDGEKRIEGLSVADVLYEKNQYDIGAQEGFEQDFIKLVRDENIGTVDVYGVATDFCCKAAVETLIRLSSKYNLGYEIIIWKDAMMGISEEDSNKFFKHYEDKIRYPFISICNVSDLD